MIKIEYFVSGFFLFPRNLSSGIQKSYLEHRVRIVNMRKMKDKKVLTEIRDMATHLRSGNDIPEIRCSDQCHTDIIVIIMITII